MRITSMWRRTLALGLVSVLTLSACGLDDDDNSANAATLRVGVLPFAAVAPVYIGLNEGYFDEVGVKVEPVMFENGTAATAALVAGEIDVSFSNWYSVVFASQQGIGLRAIAEGERSRDGQVSVQVLPDSPIQGPGDLIGKKVAVTSLKNNGDLGTSAILRELGFDASGVTFVEMAAGDMGAALERGTVDAVWTPEPTRSAIKASLNTRDVLDNNSPPLNSFPQNGYFVLADWLNGHQELVANFQCGLKMAAEYANESPENVRAVLPDYTTLSPDVIASLTFNEYVPVLDVDQVQRPADLLLEGGAITEPFDMSTIVVEPPTAC